jgi:hypothetical protein
LTTSALYQVVVIAPQKASHAGTLRSTLKVACSNLGLKPTVLRFLDELSLDRIDPALPLAAVYLGGNAPSTAEQAAVTRLCGDDAWILPVVPTLKNFGSSSKVGPSDRRGITRRGAWAWVG